MIEDKLIVIAFLLYDRLVTTEENYDMQTYDWSGNYILKNKIFKNFRLAFFLRINNILLCFF